MLEYLEEIIIIPAVAFAWSFLTLNKVLTGFYPFWQIYVLAFPFLFIIPSFMLKKYLKKINILLLPLLVFLALQIIPLPRSPYKTVGGELSATPRDEPYAVGIGFPFAYIKYFLGDGCLTHNLHNGRCAIYPEPNTQPYTRLVQSSQGVGKTPDEIHSGDIIFLPESWGRIMPGYLIDGYIIFLIVLGIKKATARVTKK